MTTERATIRLNHPSACRYGFTLLEIMVVVVIILVLVALLLVGGGEWRESAKTAQTQSTLDALDTIVEEYRLETDQYFDSGIVTLDNFIIEVQDVGNIPKTMGGLLTETNLPTIVDAWDNKINFRNPLVAPTVADRDRPWFWSNGPDQTNDSGDGTTIDSTSDDIAGPGAPLAP